MSEPRWVTGSDGVHVAVWANEPPRHHGSTVVCVHGYPDDHTVWDGVAERLGGRHRVARYDVRGAGRSGHPAARSGYRLDQLADDLRTVVDSLDDDRVHLVAHDWGSIQSWYALRHGVPGDRVASFTSLSGPDLGLARRWLQAQFRSPGARRVGARQLVRSSYLLLFRLPVVPELLWRRGILDRLLGGPSRADGDASPPSALRNRIHGLELYRANLGGGPGRPTSDRITVPVQVIAATGDRYVGVPLQTEAPVGVVDDLRIVTPEGGHWLPRSRPDVVAGLIAGFVDDVSTRQRPAPGQ